MLHKKLILWCLLTVTTNIFGLTIINNSTSMHNNKSNNRNATVSNAVIKPQPVTVELYKKKGKKPFQIVVVESSKPVELSKKNSAKIHRIKVCYHNGSHRASTTPLPSNLDQATMTINPNNIEITISNEPSYTF